jgi:hypothetical protein
MPTPAATLDAFESLGDNCEFGFVQRKNGVDPGGLLRWSVANPEALANAMEDRFSHLYSFDELTPSSDDMVCDGSYGLFFHSRMRSEIVEGKRVFKASEAKRQEIHAEELLKIRYLAEKLLRQLESAAKIFVYKRNAGLSAATTVKLHELIIGFNPRNALLVVTTGDTPGLVTDLGRGLLSGCIDRFAPYHQAQDVSYDSWLEICTRACGALNAR